MALRRLADGREEFGATSLGTIQGHMATVNLIDQRLDNMRRCSDDAGSIQQAIADIAVDVDDARESNRILALAFAQERAEL